MDPEVGVLNGDFLAEMVFPGTRRTVPLARHCVERVLTQAGHRNVDNATVVVSELVSNAVLHSRSTQPGGQIIVVVTEIGDALARIEVTDEGPIMVPRPRLAREDECCGRGLQIVEDLSSRWGVRPRSRTWKTMWAEVLTTENASIAVTDMPLSRAEL
ncbi:ATP-binding protein [Nonomuraea angiospora]|uniref:Anti-sigma regulatory factor (Ser/Thr protein kinase) n=1 Tax=Nonomuraea angiospora TaxID=46172 RepID=A0ABR9LW92_9ACTN|nr:ATP-binding protein [Nonomuraea angiospora]MBE1584577.1 anti-sigma regulatory factor (Ser/Thr protein kinase) [Nonomuraea angiospora]